MKIGYNIIEAREAQSLTQEYMAGELKITVAEYAKIENDEIDITLNRLEAIANLLSFSPIDLLMSGREVGMIKNIFVNQNGNAGTNIHIQGIDQGEIRKAYKELYVEQLDRIPKLEMLLKEHKIPFSF
ncbi:helix-turn-helix domain-containing protein [Chitinophaga cymbidii]|uniref:HTH cro/C1-type domain-containing protein n=1 Tax=Chitinophaga cymbidii TaxID=1096750 RepID=A0A512RPT8_9BACT|nr:helix-turn-helix transcriptional regulator [Chitinophaga cymbidii]GEP97713.1 hypothetical protein CCY01nite_39730 [Chitinophaga cymbidii]